MIQRGFALILLFLLLTPYSYSQQWNEPQAICLARKCGWDMLNCGTQSQCRDWLSCIRQCGEDNIKCPSFCGFYYQSKKINKLNQCVFKSNCVDLGFSAYPDYDHGERMVNSLEGIDGTYWFAAHHGGDHIFDYECQRFDLSKLQKGILSVEYSVPLTKNEQTKITTAKGTLRELPMGAIEVKYDNFVGYHELWYLVDKSKDTLLVHVCLTKGEDCHDYGTLLLSKKPLDQIDGISKERLDSIMEDQFGFSSIDLKQSNIQGCINSL